MRRLLCVIFFQEGIHLIFIFIHWHISYYYLLNVCSVSSNFYFFTPGIICQFLIFFINLTRSFSISFIVLKNQHLVLFVFLNIFLFCKIFFYFLIVFFLLLSLFLYCFVFSSSQNWISSLCFFLIHTFEAINFPQYNVLTASLAVLVTNLW